MNQKGVNRLQMLIHAASRLRAAEEQIIAAIQEIALGQELNFELDAEAAAKKAHRYASYGVQSLHDYAAHHQADRDDLIRKKNDKVKPK